MSVLLLVVMIVIAYLMGSLCSAIIVSQLFALPDPRKEGSKNPGATNVLRLSGKKYAAIVFLGDMLKGLFPVMLAHILGADTTILGLTCLAAVLGHAYPVFFSFQGGKGVATAIGALLGLNFMLGVMIIAIWLIVASFTHYASLASIVAMLFAPMLSIVSQGNANAFIPLLIITILVLYKHRENITRLTDGTETKIRFKRSLLEGVFGGKSVQPDHPGKEVTPDDNNQKKK